MTCITFTFQQSPGNNATILDGLQPGTTYKVMVCRPPFNLSADLPSAGQDPFIPECGFCAPCFATDTPFYKFERTSVHRLNTTYVQLVCEVRSNIPMNEFFLRWTISDEDGGRRRMLMNGALVDGKMVSIKDMPGLSVTSELTALDSVLERDVRCRAVSQYKTQSSDRGAFIEGKEGILCTCIA